MTNEYLQLGAIGVIFAFAIKEFFLYLRTRKNGGNYKQELADINLQLNNHMTTFNGELSDVKREITDMKMDIKLIKNSIEEIRIKMK